MNKETPSKSPTLAESIAEGLNMHGYLLQQAVRREIQKYEADQRRTWGVDASEFPVTAADGTETRIDLVIQWEPLSYINLSVECKRAYQKPWVFWGMENPAKRVPIKRFYIEQVTPIAGTAYDHMICSLPSPRAAYNFYLEMNPPPREKSEKASNADSIEKAFSQCIRGQSGLFTHATERMKLTRYCVLPVVLTTAKLYSLNLSSDDISLHNGYVDHAKVVPVEEKFVTVNYHASNSLKALGAPKPSDLTHSISQAMLRSIFVANVEHLPEFLDFLADNVVHHIART